MPANFLVALLAFISVLAVPHKGEVMIDRTFSVTPGGQLDVDILHSDILVRSSDSNEARVIVRLDGRNMSRARDWFDRMNFQVYESGNSIVIRAERPERNWTSRLTGNADIQVEIHLPSRFNLAVRTSHGDVHLPDMHGSMDVATSHGDLRLGRLEGQTMSFRSSHGDIEAEGLMAEDVRISTSHADINVARVDARTVDLETSHGNILIETRPDLDADLDLEGSPVRLSSDLSFHGDVRKNSVKGRVGNGLSHIRARTSHGSVTLRPVLK